MDTKILENIGLTHNESIVYLTLLKIGISKTGSILKNSGLNSGKIYEILESLKNKGLVSESTINNIKYFSAASPRQILEYLDKKKQQIVEEENTIKNELKNLEKFQNVGKKESIAMTYKGFKGLKTAVEEAFSKLKKGDEILGMGITSKKDERFNEFWIKLGEERAKKGIKAKNLFSERSDFLKEYKKLKLTENRVLEGITPVTVDIFGDEIVLILNYNENGTTILIYDKNTATSFRNFFYQLWEKGEK